MVDALELAPMQNPSCHYYSLIGSIPGFHAQHASLISTELLYETINNKLALLITDLLTKTSYGLKIFHKSKNNIPNLKFMLKGIKIPNPNLAAFIKAFAQPTLKAENSISALEEHLRATKFLEEINDKLSEHQAFVEQLNERLYNLLHETTSYRNYLCQQKYPFFFD